VLAATGPEKDHKSITSQAMAVINTSASFDDDQRQETLVVVVWWMVSVSVSVSVREREISKYG
jgi:hypothetical protein